MNQTTKTKGRIVIIMCILFFSLGANAQLRFQKTIGGPVLDWANSIEQTPDSGYIVLGSTKNFGAGQEDLYLIKTNQFGDTLWTRTYGGSTNDEEGNVVHVTLDGGYIIAGTTQSFGAGNTDFYLVKTDSAGNLQWSKTYGGSNMDFCTGLQQCSDGGYILSGYTNNFGAGNHDGWLIRTDASGDTLWTKTIGTTNQDEIFAVIQTSDSGFVITGSVTNGGWQTDAALIKLDAAGNISWSKCFGGSSDEIGYSAIQTSEGGYLICAGTTSFGAGGTDIYLVKTDANGDTVWTRTMGGANNDVPVAVIQNADGGYTITGFTDSFGTLGTDDLLLIKTDQAGQQIWLRTVGGLSTAKDEGRSVRQTIDGGFIVAGYTQGFGAGGGTDIFLVKTDSTGNSGCNHINVSFTEQIPVTNVTNSTGIVEGVAPGAIVTSPATIQSVGGGVENIACTTVGVNNILNQNEALVYPNPFSTSAVIEIKGDGVSDGAVFTLSDMQGRQVKKLYINNSGKGNITFTLHRDRLAPGMYFYSINAAGKATSASTLLSAGKLVVQ